MMHAKKSGPITLRNFPPELVEAVSKRAREKGLSLNKTVIGFLEEAIFPEKSPRKGRVYHDLDHLAGCWSGKEAGEFNKALADQRVIDDQTWK